MHELTEIIHKDRHFSYNSLEVERFDTIIKKWLEEKVKMANSQIAYKDSIIGMFMLKQILGILEKTLEEKFKEYYDSLGFESSEERCKKLAEIAEEHFKEEG